MYRNAKFSSAQHATPALSIGKGKSKYRFLSNWKGESERTHSYLEVQGYGKLPFPPYLAVETEVNQQQAALQSVEMKC